ncbi:MAG: hypothetical protein WBO10_10530 [Pyrinomonadaceae bacterium]
MNKREKRSTRRIKVNRPEARPKRFRTYFLIASCALLLVSGFFFAGRQHFSSMDYGMKNSKLRRQVDLLQAEKRRLMLAREVSLTPNEIKKAIQKVSFDVKNTDGEVAQVASMTKEKAISGGDSNAKPLVIRTAAVTPASLPAQAVSLETKRSSRPIKRTLAAE